MSRLIGPRSSELSGRHRDLFNPASGRSAFRSAYRAGLVGIGERVQCSHHAYRGFPESENLGPTKKQP